MRETGTDGDTLGEGGLLESDVRDIVKLVADCAVVRGGIMMQKRRLVEGLSALLDADYWMWNVAKITEEGTIVAVSILHNLSDRQLALLAEENYSAPDNPFNVAAIALCREQTSWAKRLEDIVDIEAELDRLYITRPEIDMAQSLFAFNDVPGTPGMVSAVGMHRSHNRDPFSSRELQMARVVTGGVTWLHREVVPGEDGEVLSGLPPRLQTVLSLLIDGQSSKGIASHLELSQHTVRGYIKDIYKHFGVGSQSELMRRFMVGEGNGQLP